MKNEPTKPADETTKEVNVAYDAIKPGYTTLTVEGRDNQLAYVLAGADTVACCYGTTEVRVPNAQYSATRSATDYTIVYEPVGPDPELSRFQAEYYIVAFEDSSNGDNDYNDLIVHIQQKYANKAFMTYMQPVAMGNTKKLGFGVDLYYCDAAMNILAAARCYYSHDTKTDLFNEPDQSTMLNTYHHAGTPMTTYKANTNPQIVEFKSLTEGQDYKRVNYNGKELSMIPQEGMVSGGWVYCNWFVELENGQRLYAIPAYKSGSENWVSEKGYPMGLLFAHLRNETFRGKNNKDLGGLDWIDYPSEGVDIEEVYPGFKNWLEGSGVPDWANPKKDYIDAVTNFTGDPANSIYTWKN